MPTASLLYDGVMSGSTIATAISGYSGSNLVTIPYSNGQRVLVINDGTGDG